MELPLTPSARPGRAPRRCSGAPGAGERRRFFTGRRRLRDASLRGGGAYGTSPITGRRRLRDEPPYGTSLLTGRRRWDEPPCGPEAEALRGRASLRDGALITGGAYTGRRRLRGTSLLLARRHSQTSLRTDGPEALTGRLLTGRKRLRDEPHYGAYGTSLLTHGSAFGTLTGRASLRGGTHGRAH